MRLSEIGVEVKSGWQPDGSFIVNDDIVLIVGEEDEKGGPGSGHWGHQGVPGQRGGSAPGHGAAWNIYKYSRAIRAAAAEGRSGPKVVLDAIREARPDADEHDVDMYLDVMALDREKFEYYAGRLGIKNVSSLADTYFSDMKAVDREVALKVQRVKDEATFRISPQQKYPQITQAISDDLYDVAYSGLIGETVSDAKDTLFDTYGISINNRRTESDETIHEHISWLCNMAQADPRIAAVLNKAKEIEFTTRPANSTAAMSVFGSKIEVYETALGHGPEMYIHELGHILENSRYGAFSRYIDAGGGRGRMYSSYAFTNPSEDFAETFVSLFSDAPGAPDWAPEKYQCVANEVEALL